MEETYRLLVEYFAILSRNHHYPYYVFLDRAILRGENQSIILIYKNTGKRVHLSYCYPLTEKQYAFLKNRNPKGYRSKSMESGQKCYLNCHFAYSQIEFALEDGLGFDEALGYLLRRLENHIRQLDG